MPSESRIDRIAAVLPQTQCRQCGFDGCRPYAAAIAAGDAEIDRCPPGGEAGIAKLARVTRRPILPLDASRGVHKPLHLAVVDESLCIGCTLCIQACPVDAIVGAAKRMHTVVPDLCTGCDLCVNPCPVDCIVMYPVTETTGWDAWTRQQADAARARHDYRAVHLQREKDENEARLAAKAEAKMKAVQALDPADAAGEAEKERKRAIIAAAMERARLQKESAKK